MAKFVTAINCMDGRVQLPVIGWLKEAYHASYVDVLTEPGPDRLLAEKPPESIPGLAEKIDISVRVHGSELIALAGHADCAKNKVSAQEHAEHIREGVRRLKAFVSEAKVIGLWVNADWEVFQIK